MVLNRVTLSEGRGDFVKAANDAPVADMRVEGVAKEIPQQVRAAMENLEIIPFAIDGIDVVGDRVVIRGKEDEAKIMYVDQFIVLILQILQLLPDELLDFEDYPANFTGVGLLGAMRSTRSGVSKIAKFLTMIAAGSAAFFAATNLASASTNGTGSMLSPADYAAQTTEVGPLRDVPLDYSARILTVDADGHPVLLFGGNDDVLDGRVFQVRCSEMIGNMDRDQIIQCLKDGKIEEVKGLIFDGLDVRLLAFETIDSDNDGKIDTNRLYKMADEGVEYQDLTVENGLLEGVEGSHVKYSDLVGWNDMPAPQDSMNIIEVDGVRYLYYNAGLGFTKRMNLDTYEIDDLEIDSYCSAPMVDAESGKWITSRNQIFQGVNSCRLVVANSYEELEQKTAGMIDTINVASSHPSTIKGIMVYRTFNKGQVDTWYALLPEGGGVVEPDPVPDAAPDGGSDDAGDGVNEDAGDIGPLQDADALLDGTDAVDPDAGDGSIQPDDIGPPPDDGSTDPDEITDADALLDGTDGGDVEADETSISDDGSAAPDTVEPDVEPDVGPDATPDVDAGPTPDTTKDIAPDATPKIPKTSIAALCEQFIDNGAITFVETPEPLADSCDLSCVEGVEGGVHTEVATLLAKGGNCKLKLNIRGMDVQLIVKDGKFAIEMPNKNHKDAYGEPISGFYDIEEHIDGESPLIIKITIGNQVHVLSAVGTRHTGLRRSDGIDATVYSGLVKYVVSDKTTGTVLYTAIYQVNEGDFPSNIAVERYQDASFPDGVFPDISADADATGDTTELPPDTIEAEGENKGKGCNSGPGGNNSDATLMLMAMLALYAASKRH